MLTHSLGIGKQSGVFVHCAQTYTHKPSTPAHMRLLSLPNRISVSMCFCCTPCTMLHSNWMCLLVVCACVRLYVVCDGFSLCRLNFRWFFVKYRAATKTSFSSKAIVQPFRRTFFYVLSQSDFDYKFRSIYVKKKKIIFFSKVQKTNLRICLFFFSRQKFDRN